MMDAPDHAPALKPTPLRPLHVVVIGLTALVFGGGYLLLSAAESTLPVDGAVAWRAESPLRALVQLLCLNYGVPTVNPGEVKNYILGLGAGFAILALTIAQLVGARGGNIDAATLVAPQWPADPPHQAAPRLYTTAAQAAFVLFLLWSAASSRWAIAPEMAISATLLFAIHFLWAFALGRSLNSTAAHFAARVILIVTAVTAAVALWYYYGRNWTIRAKFPFGNPGFLAACLIPGILLAVGGIAEGFTRTVRQRSRSAHAIWIIACLIVLALALWAFERTGSRGPALGLAVGLVTMLFFAVRGWWKSIPVVLLLAGIVGAAIFFSQARHAASPTGRDATLRFRTHAWSYAWRMFSDRPIAGNGQGAFVLIGDSFATASRNGTSDVLQDPLVFGARIEHAHNEWLEVMSDLGLVGILLVLAVLGCTIGAGVLTLARGSPDGTRWTLIALLAALIGLVAEEATGVGLRVSGVPVAYYTVLGLIWAITGRPPTALQRTATPARRLAITVVGGTAGLLALIVSGQDFAAARHAFEVERHLNTGEYDEAIRRANLATDQLNPQRRLTNLARLTEAHLMIARTMNDRALDREQRARAADRADVRLQELAAEDRALSEAHVAAASGTLKELVRRAPGFFRSGHLEYAISLLQAGHAQSRNDLGERDLALHNARAAIERELRRRPYATEVATDYVRLIIESGDFEFIAGVLARPLRHNRINAEYIEMLGALERRPQFDEQLDAVAATSRAALETNGAETTADQWHPEKLRLAAAVWFLRGEYARALDVLNVATAAYEQLATRAPFGAACSYGELADCTFFFQPEEPAAAIAAADRAAALAPESEPGRRLRQHVRQRQVDYYLAAGNEDAALARLRETAPPGAGEELIRTQLGLRYRRLCDTLLRRPEGRLLRKPAAALMPDLNRWITRAIELNPTDFAAHFIAADLAFHADDDRTAATHLARALEHGLPVESATQFLDMAREQRPDSVPLRELQDQLANLQP